MERSQETKNNGLKSDDICYECNRKGYWKNSLEYLKYKKDTKDKSSSSFKDLKLLNE